MLLVQQCYNEVGKYTEDILIDTCEKHPLYDEQQEDAKIWQNAIQCPTDCISKEDIKGLTIR